MPSLTTFVINLDRDADRLARITKALADIPGLDLHRISAIHGGALPQAARQALTQSARWMEGGTLGCFLSHARAWEAAAQQSAPCLILEDDAIPCGLARIHTLTMPDDFDLIFINDRMSVATGPAGAPVHCVAVTLGLRRLNETGKGVGGDGYVLTPAGARKLLAALEKDLFFHHVDWRMLRYSVQPSDLEGDLAGTRCAEVLLHHHSPVLSPQWAILKAYCLDTALIVAARGHRSSRLEIDVQ